MTLYAILVFALFGWIPIVFIFIGHVTRMNKRLDTQEAEIRQLWKENRRLIDGLCDAGISIKTNALDNHTDRIDNHADRLSALEGEQ